MSTFFENDETGMRDSGLERFQFGMCNVEVVFSPNKSKPALRVLTGFSAAAGIALINCVGNLGGFVGNYAMGAISRRTGGFHAGVVFLGFSLLTSAILLIALRNTIVPETEPFTTVSPSVVSTDIDS